MNTEFWISEALFFIVYTVATFVLIEFIRSRDGMLRKIMIAYFVIEIFTYAGSALYFWAFETKLIALPISHFRIIILIPKMIIKLILLKWLIKNRSKRHEIK